MKVEVVRSFEHFQRGQVIDLPDGVANLRIRRGFVKSVDAPQRNKMIASPKRKK
jgi:hypothetical protein